MGVKWKQTVRNTRAKGIEIKNEAIFVKEVEKKKKKVDGKFGLWFKGIGPKLNGSRNEEGKEKGRFKVSTNQSHWGGIRYGPDIYFYRCLVDRFEY